MVAPLQGAAVQRTSGPTGTLGQLPPIKKSDLRPGDVLLSCGSEALSELIRRIDGGDYSHSAMWDGQFAVDATGSGLKRRELEKDEDVQWFIDAYRWHEPPETGPVLGSPKYPTQPVLDEIDEIYEHGADFAYDGLLLAALVIWVSNRPADKWLRAAARILLSRFEAWFLKRIRKPGKTAMVCSETVARSFDQAEQPPNYAIEIIVDGSRDSAAITDAVRDVDARSAGGLQTPTRVTSYEDVKRRYGEILLAGMTPAERARLLDFAEQNARTRRGPAETIEVGAKGLPPECVTPHDLQRSPNLKPIGRLHENAAPNLPKSSFMLLLLVLKEYFGSDERAIR
jgi:hypothetical protein